MKLVVDNTRAPEGWHIDGDGWFVRCMNRSEPEIKNNEHVGFTFEGVVYVRTTEDCRNYDRGVIRPWGKTAS